MTRHSVFSAFKDVLFMYILKMNNNYYFVAILILNNYFSITLSQQYSHLNGSELSEDVPVLEKIPVGDNNGSIMNKRRENVQCQQSNQEMRKVSTYIGFEFG